MGDESRFAEVAYQLGRLTADPPDDAQWFLFQLSCSLTRVTGVEGAGVMAFDAGTDQPPSHVAVCGPWTEHERAAFVEQSRWRAEDRVLVRSLSRRPSARFHRTGEIMPEDEFRRTRLFNEFQRPRGIGDQATMLASRDDGAHLMVAFSRVGSEKPINDASLMRAQRLAPMLWRCWSEAWNRDPVWVRTLPPRRKRVLGLVMRGLDDHQIADEMGVRYNTVRAHLKELFREAGVRSRLHLIQSARRTGAARCDRDTTRNGSISTLNGF